MTVIAASITASGITDYVDCPSGGSEIKISGTFGTARVYLRISDDGGTTWQYITGPDGKPLCITDPSRFDCLINSGDDLAVETRNVNTLTTITTDIAVEVL